MKQRTVFNGENEIPNDKFLTFSNNKITKDAMCEIIGGEGAGFIIIEEIVDL